MATRLAFEHLEERTLLSMTSMSPDDSLQEITRMEAASNGPTASYEWTGPDSMAIEPTRDGESMLMAGPNLRGYYFYFPQTLAGPGDQIDIDFRIENTGDVTASNFFFAFYLSTNSTISIADHYLGGNVSPISLAAGTIST